MPLQSFLCVNTVLQIYRLGGMNMMPVHQRMAELWTEQKKRQLTFKELEEMAMCMDANANYARKLAHLYNLSLMASMTDDWDWQHEICADIDKLEIQYKIEKPDSLKSTD